MPTTVIDRLRGQALQALRIAAGFKSAAAAAAKFSWPASRYASHESGARPIREDDAKRYAAAYGVNEKQLLDPSKGWFEEQLGKAGRELYRRKGAPAKRLAVARILAGYPSYAEVARKWDLKPSTYLKHEQGKNSLADHFIELYAVIFGVRAEWLRSGELPSGLGADIDDNIVEVLRRPINFVGLRSIFSPPDMGSVASLKKAALPGRPGVSSLGIPEYDWSDIERAGGKTKGLAHRSWSMPASFFADLGLDQRSTFIVVANVARDDVAEGERFFVSSGDVDHKRSSSLVYRRDKLTVSDSTAGASWGGAILLGTILWRLAPIRRRR